MTSAVASGGIYFFKDGRDVPDPYGRDFEAYVRARDLVRRGSDPGEGYHLVHAKERTAFFGMGNEDAAGRINLLFDVADLLVINEQQEITGFLKIHLRCEKGCALDPVITLFGHVPERD